MRRPYLLVQSTQQVGDRLREEHFTPKDRRERPTRRRDRRRSEGVENETDDLGRPSIFSQMHHCRLC